MDNNDTKFRMSFSGGGFRASFYCLGAFRRLVELNLHKKICEINSVSGGSITAGAIMCALIEGEFKGISDFDKRVTVPLKKLGQCRFRNILVLTGLLLPTFSLPRTRFSTTLKFFLDLLFFKGRLMHELPEYPVWSVNATCLNTAKRFRFKQHDFGGNKIGVTKDNKNIKISLAVAVSTAFPQVFSPLKLNIAKKQFFFNWWTDNPILNSNSPKKVFLSDGGVYDNLGSESILNKQEAFIILDAGGYIPQWSTDLNPGWFKRTTRIIDTALDQVIALRRRLLYRHTKGKNGIMLILGVPAKNYLDSDDYGKLSSEVTDILPKYDLFPEEIDKLVSDLRTDLDGFHDIEIDMLMWAGAMRMDIAIKRYLKKYLNEDQFRDILQKPNFSELRIKETLIKGGKMSGPFSFLHPILKEV